jgi:hypothetical protein
MRVPGAEHGDPTIGSVCHALVSDDSRV